MNDKISRIPRETGAFYLSTPEPKINIDQKGHEASLNPTEYFQAIEKNLEELSSVNDYKKTLTEKVVVPSMSLMLIIFHAYYFRNEFWVYFLWAYSLPLIAVNVVLSKPKTIKFLRWKFFSRSEKIDTARWFINLVILDAPAVLIMRPDADVLAAVWFIVLWALRSDTIGSVSSMALTVFGIGIHLGLGLYLEHENALVNSFFVGILILAFCIYDFMLSKEILHKQKIMTEFQKAESDMEKMKRDAMLGMNAAIVSHELNGPLTILKFIVGDGKTSTF